MCIVSLGSLNLQPLLYMPMLTLSHQGHQEQITRIFSGYISQSMTGFRTAMQSALTKNLLNFGVSILPELPPVE